MEIDFQLPKLDLPFFFERLFARFSLVCDSPKIFFFLSKTILSCVFLKVVLFQKWLKATVSFFIRGFDW